MPIAEYLSWQEFYAIEPWGLAVQDAMQANIGQILANINRDTKRRPDPYQLREFLLYADLVKGRTDDVEHPRVQGLTADQWKMLMFFQALQAQQKRDDSIEQTD